MRTAAAPSSGHTIARAKKTERNKSNRSLVAVNTHKLRRPLNGEIHGQSQKI
jgi:hypothetical protein